jgi:hypothetical protein
VVAESVTGIVALWFTPVANGVLGDDWAGEVVTDATPVVVPVVLVE